MTNRQQQPCVGNLRIAGVGQLKCAVELLEMAWDHLGRQVRQKVKPLVRGPASGRQLGRRSLPSEPCARGLLDQGERVRLGLRCADRKPWLIDPLINDLLASAD